MTNTWASPSALGSTSELIEGPLGSSVFNEGQMSTYTYISLTSKVKVSIALCILTGFSILVATRLHIMHL